MRYILIPTDYQEDTLAAMEMTWRTKSQGPVHIILLSVSPIPDSMTGWLYNQSEPNTDLDKEEKLLEEWEVRKSLLGVSTEVTGHHQYGASFKLIQQIIEQFNIDSVIVPHSIQMSQKPEYMELQDSLRESKRKITWMPEQVASIVL